MNFKKSAKKFYRLKQKKSEDNKESGCSDIDRNSDDDNLDKNSLNYKFNKGLKKYSNELYKANIEIKRKNIINNIIINLFDNIDNLIINMILILSIILIF